jgi:uncharacterized protein with von Willebrand factor type A (vWA) domain
MNDSAESGQLTVNIMYFIRVLRAAGLPIGPGQLLEALRAVAAVSLTSREDFYWALHAVLVNRRDQRELFDQAFHIFWRNPKFLERMMSLMLPTFGAEEAMVNPEEISRRIADAIAADGSSEGANTGEDRLEYDAAMTWSADEVFQKKDFESMSAEEVSEARSAIECMRMPISTVPTRRYRSRNAGSRVDMRATLRAALRSGGDIIPLKRRVKGKRHPPIVVLCDISGSMDHYARMLLHFLHAMTNDRDRVHTFLFGTRLTNVTRYLRYKDIDLSLNKISGIVEDWSGGTRIGSCLHTFNHFWSRRVLGQGALVLLITDGLDRDSGKGLAEEMDRLHRSSKRLIWLNPLLRYDLFEPKSRGIRAMMPYVDEFKPIHNLESLKELAEIVGGGLQPKSSMANWRERAA